MRIVTYTITVCFLMLMGLFASADTTCKTLYPVILVHGVAATETKPVRYWGDVPADLQEHGAVVYLGHNEALSSHANNARILKEHILSIIDSLQVEKVNIIAHSKGGLESRFMISKLGMAPYVASLTTVCTPHRGSPVADEMLLSLRKSDMLSPIALFANLYGEWAGDEESNSFKAAYQLTTYYMEEFNKRVKDAPGVYYQSWASSMGALYPSTILLIGRKIIIDYEEGENDGLVSVKSARWGNFRGVAGKGQWVGVSHGDIIGVPFPLRRTRFDVSEFYIEIVKDLKKRGF